MVETKEDDDDSNRNRAKYRDATRHFEALNARLAAQAEPMRYRFKFLSPEDYPGFFQSVRDDKFREWKSGLMRQLEAGEVV